MGASLEDLRMLQGAEKVADGIWDEVGGWKKFVRNTIGEQLVRAVDSIGANIAEAFGRFHYGEKLKFLYYARGSLFETKYWLNRCVKRNLIAPDTAQNYIEELNGLARQINAFASSLKTQRKQSNQTNRLREMPTEYQTDNTEPKPLFNDNELNWLTTPPDNL